MKKKDLNFKLIALFGALFFGLYSFGQLATTFDYTGGMQTYIVPLGVTEVTFEVRGAEGGDIAGTTVGWAGTLDVAIDAGNGGLVTGLLSVTPGETLYLFVGGEGTMITGGYNGGGNAESCGGSEVIAAGGGGASDIRQGGLTLADRTVVAGGGGGVAGNGDSPYQSTAGSGAGGGLTGQNALSVGGGTCLNGAGGTAFGGGVGANNSCWCSGILVAGAGSLGVGGTSVCAPSGLSTCSCSGTGCTSGGGGGGGYYGGGAGICFSGGGGGSSYTDPTATDVIHTQGENEGHGQIIITDICSGLTVTVSDYEICLGDSFTVNGEGAGSISWDMGVENGVAFEPITSGIFTYTATSDDAGDCPFSFEVEVFELPIVIIEADDTILCDGDEVIINFDGDADSYVWLPVDLVEDEGYTADAGITTFTLTGTDGTTGCFNSASIDVEVAEPITITFVTSDELLGDDGEIDATIDGGFLPYSFDWDNDGTGDFDDTEDLVELSGGAYALVVQDSEGCEASLSIVVNSQLGMGQLIGEFLSVYPNPTTKDVVLSVEGNFNFEVIGLNGEVILSGNGTDQKIITFENFATGVYFINVQTDDYIKTVKVIKQ